MAYHEKQRFAKFFQGKKINKLDYLKKKKKSKYTKVPQMSGFRKSHVDIKNRGFFGPN